MSVAAVLRHLAMAVAAASGCAVSAAADEVFQSRVERIDSPGYSEVNVSRWARAGRADLGWGIGSISLADRRAAATTLTFADPADYERIRPGDRVSLTDLCTLVPGAPVACTQQHADGSSETLQLHHSYSAAQLTWFRSGSALNAARGL